MHHHICRKCKCYYSNTKRCFSEYLPDIYTVSGHMHLVRQKAFKRCFLSLTSRTMFWLSERQRLSKKKLTKFLSIFVLLTKVQFEVKIHEGILFEESICCAQNSLTIWKDDTLRIVSCNVGFVVSEHQQSMCGKHFLLRLDEPENVAFSLNVESKMFLHSSFVCAAPTFGGPFISERPGQPKVWSRSWCNMSTM